MARDRKKDSEGAGPSQQQQAHPVRSRSSRDDAAAASLPEPASPRCCWVAAAATRLPPLDAAASPTSQRPVPVPSASRRPAGVRRWVQGIVQDHL